MFNRAFDDTLLAYYQTPNGRQICDQFLANCKERFPRIIEEMEGMADGLGQEFIKVFKYPFNATF